MEKQKHLLDGIDYCEEHENLYVVDCAYCLISRRKSPIVDLDNQELNCKFCGHVHEEKCNCGCPAVREE